MTSLLKQLSISIKIGVIKCYGVCLVSFQIVDWIRRQSSWASCELCSHRRRRRDKTVSSLRRRRCVLGIHRKAIFLPFPAGNFSWSSSTTLAYTHLSHLHELEKHNWPCNREADSTMTMWWWLSRWMKWQSSTWKCSDPHLMKMIATNYCCSPRHSSLTETHSAFGGGLCSLSTCSWWYFLA